MNFFSNAVKLINMRRTDGNREAQKALPISDQMEQLDFSLRNYAKESFSVLIMKPLSGCMLKIMRTISFVITGILSGIVIAAICIGIFLQFGSVENTVLSSLIVSKFESLLPDMDLSIKSAMLQRNAETGSIEITMKKVRLDDLAMPRVSILPDYTESLKQHRLVPKIIYIANPKINLDISNGFRSISFNPNLEKGGNNKALFEPISATINNLKGIMDKDTLIKFTNADVSLALNGVNWNFKNVYCEYKVGNQFPRIIDCSLLLPEQEYTTSLSVSRTTSGKKHSYDIKLGSLNPSIVSDAFTRGDILLDGRILSLIEGYNLPISGNIQLNFDGKEFLGGDFDLIGATGSIKLPVRNTLSLNLGKKIDSGSVSGSFSKNGAKINSINVAYGDSGIQLTGIKVPLSEYRFLDVANIDGTLSLTNVDVQEMDALLPNNISKSTVPTFRNYLPGFKLELFKVDLRGPIAFGNRADAETLSIGQGIFKIKDAKIPLEDHVISNISATGSISDDGFDIKLTGADFRNTKINNGMFFLSKKDDSWIGKINADVTIKEISSYARDISHRLALLPLDKLDIKGVANLDLKLVRVKGDPLLKCDLPFRIVEGTGVFKSDNHSRELKIFWDSDGLFVNGDVSVGSSSVNIRMEEDFLNNSGTGAFNFISNSGFLSALIPNFHKICDGNFNLKINTSWDGEKEEYDVILNLKNAIMMLPMIGALKQKDDNGLFTAHVTKKDGNFEFSKINLDSKDSKISGSMILNNVGDILRCSLDKFEVNDSSAKINILRDADNKILFSAVGDTLDASRGIATCNQLAKDTVVSAYIDLKEMIVSGNHKVKNAKGSFNIKNGKIIGGACYAVIGEDTTLALNSKDLDGTNDSVVSLSASNAGEFLRYFKITDTISGGSINFVFKTAKGSDQSLSGAFEMSDFIAKNNTQLMKLIYLSSSSWFPNSDNISVGFNFCNGNFVITSDQVSISGTAVSPTIAIFYEGAYNRVNDNFDISGVSLPMASLLNNQGSSEAFAANYSLTGSLGMPSISVKPLQLMSTDALNDIFGHTLPITVASGGHADGDISPASRKFLSDPFSHRAFDKKTNNEPTNKNKENGRVEKHEEKSSNSTQSAHKKFGVKITRGMKRSIE
ncbi:MAG: hypothetical protein LBJ45_00450 [Holosporaceae bacterium]|jgi:hypothetical protein|nr:hypothetical protein [Holosporaceae bacterium]